MDSISAPTMRSQSFSSLSWQEHTVDSTLLAPKQTDLSKQSPGPAALSHLPGVCLFYNVAFMSVGIACFVFSVTGDRFGEAQVTNLRIVLGATLFISFLFSWAQYFQVNYTFWKTFGRLVAPPKPSPETPSWVDFATRGLTPRSDGWEFYQTLKAGMTDFMGWQGKVHAEDLSPEEPGTFGLGDGFSAELLEVSAHDRMKAYYTQCTGPSAVIVPHLDPSLGAASNNKIYNELLNTLMTQPIYSLDRVLLLAAVEDAFSWLALAAYTSILGMLIRACVQGGDLAPLRGGLGAVFLIAALILLYKNYSQTRRSSAEVALQEKIWLSWDFVPKTKDKFQEDDMNALGSMVVNDKLVGTSGWHEEDDVKGNLPQAWMMLASTMTHIGACYMASFCHNNAMLSKEMIYNAIDRKFNYPGVATLYLQAKRCSIACLMCLIAPCMCVIPESMLSPTEVKGIWIFSFLYMIKNAFLLAQRADHGEQEQVEENKKLKKQVRWFVAWHAFWVAVAMAISVGCFVKFHVMADA